jgi:hypothetical protein
MLKKAHAVSIGRALRESALARFFVGFVVSFGESSLALARSRHANFMPSKCYLDFRLSKKPGSPLGCLGREVRVSGGGRAQTEMLPLQFTRPKATSLLLRKATDRPRLDWTANSIRKDFPDSLARSSDWLCPLQHTGYVVKRLLLFASCAHFPADCAAKKGSSDSHGR